MSLVGRSLNWITCTLCLCWYAEKLWRVTINPSLFDLHRRYWAGKIFLLSYESSPQTRKTKKSPVWDCFVYRWSIICGCWGTKNASTPLAANMAHITGHLLVMVARGGKSWNIGLPGWSFFFNIYKILQLDRWIRLEACIINSSGTSAPSTC